MCIVFIAHGWSDSVQYNTKQLEFIRLLQNELQSKGLTVIFDENCVNKVTLYKFMRENISDSQVILPICDEVYYTKSEQKGTGVYYEINQIIEQNCFEKVVPILISENPIPKDFGTIEYISFKKEFEKGIIDDDSEALDKLFTRIADYLDKVELYPSDHIKPEVLSEINSLGLLSTVINNKDVTLSEIYTYPDLSFEEDQGIKYISTKRYLRDKKYKGKTIFVGDRQSGKSSLAKKLFIDLYEKGLQPVFIEKGDITSNNIDKIISRKYIKTYLKTHKNKKENIIVLIDDYHNLEIKHQNKIRELSDYAGIILFVDDIFDISFSKEFLFKKYIIQPMKPSLRADLIEKLIMSQRISFPNENDRLKKIDESLNLINASLGLGKGFRNGIIPAFPLYILTILGAASDVRNKLDSPISSHGHCYQLLISLTFQNCGINNDLIDSYINFLTYLAKFLYDTGNKELTNNYFNLFLANYKKDYSIYKEQEYIEILFKTGLIKKNNFSYISFSYDYIYYFFLGKYFSENFEDSLEDIEKIVSNLESRENGNICIFIAHHSKSPKLIKLLYDNLSSIFKQNIPSKLSKDELAKLDEEINSVLKTIVVKIGNYKEERKKELEQRDELEEIEFEDTEDNSTDGELVEAERQKEIRKAIQTVEVIGVILKNRHGSIKKQEFESILLETVNTNLRLLDSFIISISSEDFSENFEELIQQIIKDDKSGIEKNELRKQIRDVFFKMIFGIIYGIIMKTINSIGSEVISNYFSTMVSSSSLSPSYILILRGMELYYQKQFSEKEILRELKDSNISNIAKSIIKLMVIDYASKHNLNFKEKARIESEFGFRTNSILEREQQLKLLDK